jgi:hypothetical protein
MANLGHCGADLLDVLYFLLLLFAHDRQHLVYESKLLILTPPAHLGLTICPHGPAASPRCVHLDLWAELQFEMIL